MRARPLALPTSIAACAALVLSLGPCDLPANAFATPPSAGASVVTTPEAPATPRVAGSAAHRGAPVEHDNTTHTAQGALTRVWSRSELKAATVVRAALSKVHNSRYVWGASSGHSFDCSGLMLFAYRQIGITLPHSSQAQSRLGTAVAKDALRPGDLLFFYSPVHHVGMYIGGGKFVHARSPRNGLAVTTLSSYPNYRWARRIIAG
ncbi:C40 family peptidase [Micropruina sp.]|uniref:C40 family peptidase n=1 Tax=Micropruina sp. TaxID=2737536 RepID=UPI0039E267B9